MSQRINNQTVNNDQVKRALGRIASGVYIIAIERGGETDKGRLAT